MLIGMHLRMSIELIGLLNPAQQRRLMVLPGREPQF